MNTTPPSARQFDTVVIGGGMAGVSIAYELAAHQSVAVVEMESTLAYHSTGRSAAAFLESYGNQTIRLLTTAGRSFFADEDGHFDVPVARPLDLLMIANDDEQHALRELHHEISARNDLVELVSGDTAEQLNPLLRPGCTTLGMIDRSALELDVHALHQWYLRGFRARGGTVVRSAGIVDATHTGHGWDLTDAAGAGYRAQAVVNAAGAWCDRVAGVLGAKPIGIRPLRRTAFMVSAPPEMTDAAIPLTMAASETFYVKPDGAQFLCSPADETPQAPGDARPDDLEIARAIESINDATTLGIRSVNSAWAGLRSFVADRTPVVGPDTTVDGLFWHAAQGGYGIQIAPALARFGAALVTGEPLPTDLADLGLTPSMLGRDRTTLATIGDK
ncbi:NAD(P)/FAD-dependent oxidoreductase [Gordonia aichiensis]|uniref:Putative oxidoreductase n=1 Tax=Gordonia aichiensis NBRC 108223 TaxID=1220583 RepID=L7KNP1_9ACTN|nr:FAD-dependent oxidoreductase [Gordonia aichiensis]GAC50121.1 putative oxidoreductase [Gordonia aichiensis NBRC 108223]